MRLTRESSCREPPHDSIGMSLSARVSNHSWCATTYLFRRTINWTYHDAVCVIGHERTAPAAGHLGAQGNSESLSLGNLIDGRDARVSRR
jgi:hypothetical protein